MGRAKETGLTQIEPDVKRGEDLVGVEGQVLEVVDQGARDFDGGWVGDWVDESEGLLDVGKRVLEHLAEGRVHGDVVASAHLRQKMHAAGEDVLDVFGDLGFAGGADVLVGLGFSSLGVGELFAGGFGRGIGGVSQVRIVRSADVRVVGVAHLVVRVDNGDGRDVRWALWRVRLVVRSRGHFEDDCKGSRDFND